MNRFHRLKRLCGLGLPLLALTLGARAWYPGSPNRKYVALRESQSPARLGEPGYPATAPAATQPATTAPDPDPIAFETTLQAAVARAKAEGKPLLVEFMSPTCQYCRRMERGVYPNAEVKQFAKQFVWARIDQTQGEGLKLVRQFHGGATPMYFAVAHDGATAYFKQSGSLPVNAFIHSMSILLTPPLENSKPAGEGSANSTSPGQLLTAAKNHLMAGQLQVAKSELQQVVVNDPANASGAADDALLLLGQIDFAAGGPNASGLAIGPWIKLMKEYPKSDRGPDAVLYLAIALKAAGQLEQTDKLKPFLKTYPENVDVSACVKVIEGGS